MTPEPRIEDYLPPELLAKIQDFQAKRLISVEELQGKPFKTVRRQFIHFQDGTWAMLFASGNILPYMLDADDRMLIDEMEAVGCLSRQDVADWEKADEAHCHVYVQWMVSTREARSEQAALLESRGFTVTRIWSSIGSD